MTARAMDDGPSSDGDGGPVIDLALDDPAWLDRLPDARAVARRACLAALETACPRTAVGVSLSLADDEKVRALNRAWRGVDRPTDVLSFPSAERTPGEALRPDPTAPPGEPVGLGDVVLARQTVLSEADEAGLPPADRLAHLVVHGALHLLGHDHGDEADAAAMEALERRALAGLGVPDPYG